MATHSALRVPRWCKTDGQNVKCATLHPSNPQRTPSWLRSGRGGTTNLLYLKPVRGGHSVDAEGCEISMYAREENVKNKKKAVFDLRQPYPDNPYTSHTSASCAQCTTWKCPSRNISQ